VFHYSTFGGQFDMKEKVTTGNEHEKQKMIERRTFLKAGTATLLGGALGSVSLDALAQTSPIAIAHGT
jgi:hypothetical protein